MGFRPREPAPPEASRACLPVGRRRVQLCPALPHPAVATASPRNRLALAAPERWPPGPAHSRPPESGPHVCPARGRVRRRNHDGLPRYVTETVELLTILAPSLHRRGAHRVGEGISDPGRHAPADRPHCRGPPVLLRQAQETRDERAGHRRLSIPWKRGGLPYAARSSWCARIRASVIVRSNSTGGSPPAALCLRRVLKKSVIHVAIFSRAPARVAKRCRWMYSTLIEEWKDSAAALCERSRFSPSGVV